MGPSTPHESPFLKKEQFSSNDYIRRLKTLKSEPSTEPESTKTTKTPLAHKKKDILSETLDLKSVARSVISRQHFLAKFGKSNHKPRKNTLDNMFPNAVKKVIAQQRVFNAFRTPKEPVGLLERNQSEEYSDNESLPTGITLTPSDDAISIVVSPPSAWNSFPTDSALSRQSTIEI